MQKSTKVEILLGVFILLIAANFFVWREILSWDGKLRVVFFDVGQGDSIFVETPEKYQILIDGGPDGRVVLEKLGKEMPFWDRTIDLVILTHPEYDHLQGLLDVLDRYKVENILWTGVQRETNIFEKWLEKIKKEETDEDAITAIAQRGQGVKAGNARLYILYPLNNMEGELFEKNSNDSSVVAKLNFGKNTFLFSGDISQKVEKQLLERDSRDQACVDCNLATEVLKVAHHGSKSSNSKDFLEKVGPTVALISCGKNNKYGHPHPEVLNRLGEFGINVLRTDEKGDIKIKANYEGYSISNF